MEADLIAALHEAHAVYVITFDYQWEYHEKFEEEFDTLDELAKFRADLVCGRLNYCEVENVHCFKRINLPIDHLFVKE